MALVMSPEYRIPPSAMIGNVGMLGRLGRLEDGGHLRHTHSRDHPRRANRSGTDAHLHRIRAGGQQVLASFLGCHVSRNDVNVPPSLDLADRLQHIRRMPVSTVHDQNVNAFGNQALRSVVVKHSDRRSHPQPAQLILAGMGEPFHHVNVFDRDESGQFV